MSKAIIVEGTVISGTLRVKDLLPALANELERIQGKYYLDLLCAVKHVDIESEAAAFLVDDLYGALNELAPEGYYFGGHPGDPADIGWWRHEADRTEAVNTAATGVLTENELHTLLKIPTNPKQALQILQRNLSLLANLQYWIKHGHQLNSLSKADRVYKGSYGCPHCNTSYYCGSCAWTSIESFHYHYPCCHFTFGGITYASLQKVKAVRLIYEARTESLTLHLGQNIPLSTVLKELHRVRTFILGHVYWARAILHNRYQNRNEDPGSYEGLKMQIPLQEAGY